MTSIVQANIAVIVGSLRKDSLNRRAARALSHLAPKGIRLEIVEIGGLPLYDPDLDDEGRVPEAWKAFRDKMKAFDAVLFVTPEYNRSVPGALKNAIDVGSRPYGQSVWDGKPAAVMSVSPSAIGGFGANHHLRQSLVFLNMPVLQQPEAYVGNAATLFLADGGLATKETREFFTTFVTAFASWIGALAPEVQPARVGASR
jgi:chromate reductase